jgi:hypothetical protein
MLEIISPVFLNYLLIKVYRFKKVCKPGPSDKKDLTIAVFQTAISNLFISRALPWAVALPALWADA